MGDGDTAGMLSGLALLADLDSVALTRVHAAGEARRYAPGDQLVRQGEPGHEVHLVLSGAAAITSSGHEVGRLGTGDLLGELSAYDAEPRSATVTAITAMQTLAFDLAAFEALLEDLPVLRRRLTSALTGKLRQITAGWAEFARDPGLLLEAFLSLQRSADPVARTAAVRQAAALLLQVAADDGASVAAQPDALTVLTPTERRVASLVAEGLSNSLIAEHLVVSRHTVESHLKHTYSKLGLTSRLSLATLVLRAGPAGASAGPLERLRHAPP